MNPRLGTIQNSDPMPRAWIARFGRTVASHVVDAIQDRLLEHDTQSKTSHITVGGIDLRNFFVSEGEAAAQSRKADSHAYAPHYVQSQSLHADEVFGQPLLTPSFSDTTFMHGRVSDHDVGGVNNSALNRSAPRVREMLRNSSFYYTNAVSHTGFGRFGARLKRFLGLRGDARL